MRFIVTKYENNLIIHKQFQMSFLIIFFQIHSKNLHDHFILPGHSVKSAILFNLYMEWKDTRCFEEMCPKLMVACPELLKQEQDPVPWGEEKRYI